MKAENSVFRSPFIVVIVLLSVAAATIFPIYTLFLQNPQFTALFRDNTINEAAHLAEQLSALLLTAKEELSQQSFSRPFVEQLERLQTDSHFVKLRVYAPDGEILFSADETEIGEINNEPYFKDIVVSGDILTKEVAAGSQSMDKETIETICQAIVSTMEDLN